MLPLKKFLRYADYGNGTVAVFETGFKEFIEAGPITHGVDALKYVGRERLEQLVDQAEAAGIDAAAERRVLANWPV